MRRLVIGDIHGNHKAMIDVLEKANFNVEKDLLIGIGDYVDGVPEVKKVVDYLISLPNFQGVIGNHDIWFRGWLNYGYSPSIWTTSDEKTKNFFNSLPKYLEIDNMLFVHGGYIPILELSIKEQAENCNPFDLDITWDRKLFSASFRGYSPAKLAYESAITYDKVFIGHTTTQVVNDELLPLFSEKVVAIDTGAGGNGKLIVMDIDTLEYWQSEVTQHYYPD